MRRPPMHRAPLQAKQPSRANTSATPIGIAARSAMRAIGTPSALHTATVRASAPYDLVFANILARPLVGLAQPIRRALKPGGTVILSGLLRSQERMVRAAYLARGLRLTRRIHRDAWATLVLERPRGDDE